MYKVSIHFACLLLFLLTVMVPLIAEALYSENDLGITNLDVKNFNPTVLHSSTAWMVEFYKSSCGYCQRFAPT